MYQFFGDRLPLPELLPQVPRLATGGTLSPILGTHALRRGYRATMHTYNLQVFDPTWSDLPREELAERLRARIRSRRGSKSEFAARKYLMFLEAGGCFRFEDLTPALIRGYIEELGLPVLTGLSATYLYRSMREYGPNADFDDVRGDPSGHFVILCGYRAATRDVLVADPLYPNPFATTHHYFVNIDRVVCAILLGTLTYDANLLILEPPNGVRPSLPAVEPNQKAVPPDEEYHRSR